MSARWEGRVERRRQDVRRVLFAGNDETRSFDSIRSRRARGNDARTRDATIRRAERADDAHLQVPLPLFPDLIRQRLRPERRDVSDDAARVEDAMAHLPQHVRHLRPRDRALDRDEHVVQHHRGDAARSGRRDARRVEARTRGAAVGGASTATRRAFSASGDVTASR